MLTVAATFNSSERARAAVEAVRALRGHERVTLLMPGTRPREVEGRVPTDEGESPGMGGAVGSVVGGALGLAAASVILPGVGPVVVAGMMATGLAGAAGGAAVGDKLEDTLTRGIPRDELEAYKAALGRGCAVVIAGVDNDEEAEAVRDLFGAAGAQAIDPAREDWRTGLREPTSG